MATQYAVINQYGIGLRYEDEHPRDDGYTYKPRVSGEEGYARCERFCRRHDSANTCAIVIMEGEKGELK